MLNAVDNLLDRITMYRLLLYYLIALVLAAIGLSAAGDLHFSTMSIIVSTVVLVVACGVVNEVFAYIFDVPSNLESTYITALILALIITPMTSYTTESIGFLLAASGLAMASKYVLTIRRKHIFNPAAIAVVLTALGPKQSASWWIGTSVLLPFVLIGGLLLVRKIRRMHMVLTFFATSLLATALYTLIGHGDVLSVLDKTVMTSAMFFLGFVMLTEPLTTPPTSNKQTWYAVLVGVLFPPQFHILKQYSTPELALSVGNIFSYIISPKAKLLPTLKKKIWITPDSADFIFNPNQNFAYEPGQYMEWTLPHSGADNRGKRRYFTLASSPTEPDIRIGVKFYERSSSYKKALLQLSAQSHVVAAQAAGDFTLPKDAARKLVFIAGGIGVTPYRSMIQYLLDTGEARDITLLYSAKSPKDFAYKEVFETARRNIGVKTVYVATDSKTSPAINHNLIHGRINAELIRAEVSDYHDRLYYVSGTPTMVQAIRHTLHGMGVPRRSIKVDYFSGYA